MAKQLNLDLNVRANTSQAKAEFQSLQKSLSDVVLEANKIKDPKISSASLKEASNAAQELQRHLSNAVNVDTGKLNLNKLNTSLKQSKANIGELSGKLLATGETGQQAFIQLAQSVAQAERPVISLGSRLNGLLTTLKNTARWQISSSILHGFMGALQGAYGYAQDLNKSLNNIRVVTGQNTEQMAKFAETANKAAKTLSTTTTSYTDAALIYYQQGLSDSEVKERTDTTIKLANVSRQSAEEVSSQMTAIWNNFDDGTKKLEYYADVITALGASTASSSQEIAEGLSKFAAVADTVGLSYEKASAALATVVAETRQSADTVGTAFKTLFARIEGLSLGKTLEDGTDLNKYSKALETIGVNIKDQSGELKQMDTILNDIGAKWQTLNKDQQVALAQTVAGVRQYTQFVALMDNYNKVQENQSIAENSEGTVQKQADIYAESWEAAQKRAKASLQSIYDDLLDDKFFIAMTDGFAKLMDGLHNFIKGIGGLKGVLIGLGSLFLNYISDKIMPAMQNLKITLTTIFKSPAKQAEEYQKIMSGIILQSQNIPKDQMSDSLKNQLMYTDQLSEARNKLMQVEKNLTDMEKIQAESQLHTINLYEKEAQALADKITKEKEEIEVLMDSMTANKAVQELKKSRQEGLDVLKEEKRTAKEQYESYNAPNKQGIVLDNDGNDVTAEYLEAADKYAEASEKVRAYKKETEDLASAQEDIATKTRLAYESFMALDEQLDAGKVIEIDLSHSLEDTASKFSNFGNNVKASKIDFIEAGEALDELDQLGLTAFEDVQGPVEKARNAIRKYQQTLKNTPKDTQALGKAGAEVRKKMQALGSTLKDLKPSFTKNTDGAKKFNQAMKAMGEGENAKKIDASYKNLNKSQQKLKDAQNRVNQAFQDFNPQHLMSGVEGLTKIASAGMQAGMVISSIKTMITSLADENMDPFEKITTSLMSVGMIVPGIISSLQGISTVIKAIAASSEAYQAIQAAGNVLTQAGIAVDSEASAVKAAQALADAGLIASTDQLNVSKALANAQSEKGAVLSTKETLKIAAKAMATTGETIATEGATGAQWSLNAAMDANPIGAIIALIVALIATLALLTFALISAANAESEENKAMREANEALDEAKESAEKAKQAYEDLKNAVSNYDSAIDALKKCTKGTQEWRDAFREVLHQANELIQKYPQLLSYEKIFNSDGTLNTEVLDKAVKDAEKASIAMENVVLEKQNNLTLTDYNIKKKKTIASAAEDAGKKSSNYKDSVGTKTVTRGQGRDSYTVTESVSMEELTKAAVSAIGDKIGSNYDNKAVVKELVQSYLEDQNTYKIKDDKLNDATDTITDSIMSVSNNFEGLSQETEKTMNTMNNASKMLLQNLFGEDLTPEKELAYEEAKAEKEEELRERYQKAYLYTANLEDSSNDDIDTMRNSSEKKLNNGDVVSGELAAEMLDIYVNKIHTGEYGEIQKDNAYYWKDNTVYTNLTDAKTGQRLEDKDQVKMSKVQEEVIAYMLAQSTPEMKNRAEEIAKSNSYQQTNSAMMRYMNDFNFNNATIGDMKKLQSSGTNLSSVFGDENGNLDDEKIKDFLARKLNKDKKDISEDMINQFKSGFDSGLKSSLESVDKIPKVIQERMGEGLLNSLTADEAAKVGKIYAKAMAKEGSEGAELLNDITKSAGNEAGKVMSALADIDLSNMGIKETNEQLKKLGIQFQLTESQFYSFKNVLKDVGAVTAESAKETYKNISSVLSKLKKAGDTLEDADYQKLLAINPAISSFFTTMADGTYMLTGAVQDFKKAVQSATINELYSAQKNDEETAAAYGNLSKGYTKRSEMDDGAYIVPGVSQTQYRDTGLWSKYQDQTVAQIKILRDNGQSDLADQLDAQINEGKNLQQVVLDAADAYDKLNLSAEDYTTKAEEASKEAAELAESIKEAQYQNEISNAGLEYETTENYANVLMELYEAQGLSKDAARELSIANQRLDNGLSSLNDNFEDWSKSLKNTNKASAEYAETVTSIREAFANLLNVADGNELSLEWLENWMNDSSEMEKILDGDTEALQRFRESAFKEMTTNVFSDMKNSISDMLKELDSVKDKDYIASLQAISDTLASGAFEADNLRAAIVDLGNQEIGSGATLSQEYVDSLNEMLAQGLLTEQQLNDIFATIGYKPKVTTKNVQQWVDIPQYETVEDITETKKPDGKGIIRTTKSYTRQIDVKHMQQNVPVAQIESADEATGNIEIVNAGSANIIPSYSSTSSGKSSDDSNSSSDNKTTSAASHEHEVNRYSDEENAINGLADQYERLGKIKDKAFGAGVLQAMEKELSKLKELKQASSNYLEAIVGAGNAEKVAQTLYSGGNIGSLISSGQLGGTVTADYNSLFRGTSASGKNVEYTAKDSAGNEYLASTNYNLNDFKSIFGSNINFQLDSYGNITNKDSILNELQRLKNNENSNYSNYADPDAATTTEHNKRIAYLDEIKERIEQYGTTVEDLSTQTDAYLDYISQIQEKNAEIISTKLNDGITLSNNTLTRLERALKILGDDIYKSTEKMAQYFDTKMNSNRTEYQNQAQLNASAMAEVQEKVKLYQENPLDENAISPAQAAEIMQTIEENYANLYEKAAQDIADMEELYGNTIDKQKEKISELTTQIDFNIQKLDHLQKVFELLGKKTNYKQLGKILNVQAQGAETNYNVQKAKAEEARKLYSEHQAKAAKMSGTELEEYEKTVLAKDRALLQEYEKEEQTAFQTWIEKLQAIHDNNINQIYQDFEDNLTGEYGSFSNLDAAMERQKSITEEYLTKTNQLYETNKMLRNLQKDIDKTDNRIAKEKLKAFSDEITAMQNKEKLTKTDLDLAKAKYEVLKAQIALEEAQNAKSTVRLQRDNEGNYGYIYTADQDKISDAEQNLADKENALYNLALSQANDFSQKLEKIGQEYMEARKKLEQERDEGLISEEQYEQSLIELQDYYRDLELRYLDGYNTAAGILDDEAIEGRVEAWGAGFEHILNDRRLFNDESTGAAQDLNSALQTEMQDWNSTRQSLLEEAGLDNKNFEDTIGDVTNEIKDLGDQITKDGGLIDQFDEMATSTEKLTRDFVAQYEALLDEANGYLEAANQANAYQNELAQLTNQQLQYNAALAAQSSTVTFGNTSGNYNNNSSEKSSSYDSSTSPKIGNNKDSSSDKTKNYQFVQYSSGGAAIEVKDTSTGKTFWVDKYTARNWGLVKFKSGGYTGSWNGPDLEENGKLAFLHQKELVLNATDTENMLNAIKLIRQISQTIDLQAATQSSALSLQAAQFSNNGQVLQQEVTIHAEFPNATNHNEIEEAFNNLVNRASQFASRQ